MPSPSPAAGAALPRQPILAFRSIPFWCFAALACWLAVRVFVADISHDESQYVAGADLALHHTIFRDYLSLQPPLQSWVYAPVAWLFPDDVFLSMRMMTALLSLATVVTVYLTLRSVGVIQRNALVCALAMASVNGFEKVSSLVRNDILPALLLSLGLWAALKGIREREVDRWLLAGIGFGLAASTKLSYVPFGVTAGAFVLFSGRDRLRTTGAYAAGLAIGLIPSLIAWARAPGSFLWGVITFGASGPFDWYRGIGESADLTPFHTVGETVGYLLLGPAMLALMIVGSRWQSALTKGPARQALFLALMILAGLIGALLPTPTHSQYVVPLLPPLFVTLGVVLPTEFDRAKRTTTALIAFAVVGLAPSFLLAYHAIRSGSPILTAEADAGWMRRQLPAAVAGAEISSFSPELAVDSGLPIDDDFATGPFVFRTGYLLNPRTAAAFHVAVPSDLERVLDQRLPEALLTGYESFRSEGCLDDYLDQFALDHGYRLLRLPDGKGRLYVRAGSDVTGGRSGQPSLRSFCTRRGPEAAGSPS